MKSEIILTYTTVFHTLQTFSNDTYNYKYIHTLDIEKLQKKKELFISK